MLVIGLTGGIGSGKSEVARFLEELGAAVVNADLLGHQTYAPGSDGWREVVDAFGPEVVGPDGQVDRKKLGALVFSDPQALRRLNAITHPRIRRLIQERLRELEGRGVRVAVVEAALLLEAGWDALVHQVWVVTAPQEVALQRAAARTGLPLEDLKARARHQLPQQARVKRADAVIDNSGDLEQLKAQVLELWNTRVRPRKESKSRP